MAPEVPEVVDHLFRREAGRMVAALTRVFGAENLALAEDVVQESLVQALRAWPFGGVPENPGGWLMRVAKNRALDLLRRETNLARKEEAIRGWSASLSLEDSQGEAMDDQLRMIFICCQPAVPREARVALTLKTVGGFGVPEIARAYLAREATIAQRLVRAKRKIQEIRPPFEVPPPAELPAALDSVLEALYLMFNEGYAASAGEELVRQDVCAEAIRLARLVAEHPSLDVPKAHALAALLLLQAARNSARVDLEGNLLLLSEQDRDLWDQPRIAAGFHHLERAARGPELLRLPPRGGDRGLSRGARRDRLALHPSSLRRPSRPEALPRRGPQPRRGPRHGRGARGGDRGRRGDPEGAFARGLLPAAGHPGEATPAPGMRNGRRRAFGRRWRWRARSRCGDGFKRGHRSYESVSRFR